MHGLKTTNLTSLLFSSTLMLCSPDAAAQDNKRELTQLLDVWLNYQKDANDIPAIMAAIVQDNTLLWSQGVGYSNLTKKIRANSHTLTNICSNSKVVTATAIMALVEQGKITLDTDIQTLLPDYQFTHKFSDKGPVTIFSLLNHTSGLPRDSGHGYWSAPDFYFPNKNELIQSLSSMSTHSPVGTVTAYSNVGYALLGAAIEQVSGMSYREFIKKALFNTLKMKDSVAEMPTNSSGKEHAKGYSAPNRYGDRTAVDSFKTHALQPAAGVSTTIQDWSKFALWQLDKNDNRLMSQSSKQQMITPQTADKNGWSRGLGYQLQIDKQGDTWAMHGGMCPGFNSYMKLNIDKQQGFAVFTNANKVRAAAYVKGLINITDLAKSTQPASNIQVDVTQYAGFYDPFPWNSKYYVSPWRGGLVFMYLPSESLDYALEVYRPLAKDVFVKVVNNKITDEKITFIRDKLGNITHVSNGGNLHAKENISDS